MCRLPVDVCLRSKERLCSENSLYRPRGTDCSGGYAYRLHRQRTPHFLLHCLPLFRWGRSFMRLKYHNAPGRSGC